jgi:hypothetical protein
LKAHIVESPRRKTLGALANEELETSLELDETLLEEALFEEASLLEEAALLEESALEEAADDVAEEATLFEDEAAKEAVDAGLETLSPPQLTRRPQKRKIIDDFFIKIPRKSPLF